RKTVPATTRYSAPQMNADVSARLDLEAALREAVRNPSFAIAYQPMLCLTNARICGLAALLRWPRPGHPGVSPAVFVPVLASLGLIGEVGNWVVDSVCAQIARWQRPGLGLFQVAVHISGQQISSSSLVADIRQAPENHHVAPQRPHG
ncbi:EAL domain-containing protein, partial [Pseudomonas syringae]